MENNNNDQPVYKRPVDEYLPCEDYKGDEGFVKFFRDDEKRFYFAFNGSSGKTYLRSQGYQNEPGRDNGVDSVIRNAPLDERWKTGYNEEEKYYYYALKAGNRQEIARSCEYDSEDTMLAGLVYVRGEKSLIGVGSKLVGGALMSAALLAAAEAPKEVKLEKIEEPVVPPIAATAVPPIDIEEKKGCGRWWPWLLLLALLIILCLIFCRGCDETEKIVDTPQAVIEKVDESVKNVGKTVTNVVEKTTEGVVGGVVAGVNEAVSGAADKLETAIASGDSFVLEGLNFVYGSNNLTLESQTNLKNVADVLKKHADVKIEIQGHTDDVGNDEFNRKLSNKRANSIKNYLVKNGIRASRLQAVGYGERHPVASNLTDEGRAKNRRIEE